MPLTPQEEHQAHHQHQGGHPAEYGETDLALFVLECCPLLQANRSQLRIAFLDALVELVDFVLKLALEEGRVALCDLVLFALQFCLETLDLRPDLALAL